MSATRAITVRSSTRVKPAGIRSDLHSTWLMAARTPGLPTSMPSLPGDYVIAVAVLIRRVRAQGPELERRGRVVRARVRALPCLDLENGPALPLVLELLAVVARVN